MNICVELPVLRNFFKYIYFNDILLLKCEWWLKFLILIVNEKIKILHSNKNIQMKSPFTIKSISEGLINLE